MFWLAADVEGLGRFALHAVGELETVNPGVERRIKAALLFVILPSLTRLFRAAGCLCGASDTGRVLPTLSRANTAPLLTG